MYKKVLCFVKSLCLLAFKIKQVYEITAKVSFDFLNQSLISLSSSFKYSTILISVLCNISVKKEKCLSMNEFSLGIITPSF